MPELTIDSRECVRCRTMKPESDYYTPNHDNCKDCIRVQSALGRQHSADTLIKAKIATMQRAIHKVDASHVHITEIADEMIAQFGGVVNFCKSWKKHIDGTEEGSKAGLDAHNAVAKLIGISTRVQQDKTRAEQMSEEDIERELRALILDVSPRLTDGSNE